MSQTEVAPEQPNLREQVETSCAAAFDLWRQARHPENRMEDERRQIVGRSAVWIGPMSVAAGVVDVMRTVRLKGNATLSEEDMGSLADDLVKAIKTSAGFGTAATAPPKKMGM